MAIAFDTTSGATGPTISGGARTSSFTTVTGIKTGGADRILLALIGYNSDTNGGGAARTITSVTDGLGLTWTKRKAIAWNFVNSGFTIFEGLELWWAHAPTTIVTPDAVTVNFSGVADNVAVQLIAVSGVASFTAPFDANGGLPVSNIDNSGSTTTPSATVSTSQSHDLHLMLVLHAGLTTQAAGSGWTLLQNEPLSGADGVEFSNFCSQFRIVSAPVSGAAVSFGTSVAHWGVIFDALSGDVAPIFFPYTQSRVIT